MARFYGDTRDFIDKATQIAAQAGIALDMAECRYCKAAQKRAMNALAAYTTLAATATAHGLDASGSASIGTVRRIEFMTRICKVAGCKAHLESQRLAYLTSPVSETYWAS